MVLLFNKVRTFYAPESIFEFNYHIQTTDVAHVLTHSQYCQIRMSTDIFSFLHMWVVGQKGVTVYKIYPLESVFFMLMCQLLSVGISP